MKASHSAFFSFQLFWYTVHESFYFIYCLRHVFLVVVSHECSWLVCDVSKRLSCSMIFHIFQVLYFSFLNILGNNSHHALVFVTYFYLPAYFGQNWLYYLSFLGIHYAEGSIHCINSWECATHAILIEHVRARLLWVSGCGASFCNVIKDETRKNFDIGNVSYCDKWYLPRLFPICTRKNLL